MKEQSNCIECETPVTPGPGFQLCEPCREAINNPPETMSDSNGIRADFTVEEFIPELLELARGEDHDQADCPQDDTCRCANIAKLNAELKAIQRMRARS